MPRYPHIEEYRRDLGKAVRVGGSPNESSTRYAFEGCLRKYCEDANLVLIPELKIGGKNIPDGTVRDEFQLNYGYWEAKDEKDDLDSEIAAKRKRGYPTDNIIFENSQVAVLIRGGEEIRRINMEDSARLDSLLRSFVGYAPPAVEEFRSAVSQFTDILPKVLVVLRKIIERERKSNSEFAKSAADFLAMCQTTINNTVGADDVREMLIQHILTRDIFLRVFDEEQFHRDNNIARDLDKLMDAFLVGDARRNALNKVRSHYAAIQKAAHGIASHREKQKFLKAVYEKFYRAYNPKAADRLGVFYTPEEIVKFIVRAADDLVHRHFNRRLWSKGVQILDPAAGTGTFVTELIEHFPKGDLPRKYSEELHANEVGILPYYIANLNIEYTYKTKMGEYREFPGICFVDTLDNLGFGGKGQSRLPGAWSQENIKRIKKQNEKEISVIVGNPPYNANQLNENDDNKNREYGGISGSDDGGVDGRIRSTYLAASSATKTKLYDMYVRFVRWSSDRLGKNGVLGFVSNSSFIEAYSFDGFRKIVADEFNEIWILDLKGASRGLYKKDAKKQGGNVFGVRVGIAVWFFVKKEGKRGCDIHYCSVSDGMSAADKLAFLSGKKLSKLDFRRIDPDENHNWINQPEAGDFDKMLRMVDKAESRKKDEPNQGVVFYKFGLGVSTNRDAWVYDIDAANLRAKVRFFIKQWKRLLAAGRDENFDTVIKWSRDLKNEFSRSRAINFSGQLIVDATYRPFTVRKYYADFMMSDMLTKNHYDAFGPALDKGNRMICFNARGKEFYLLATNNLADLHFTGDTQCIPLYHYDEDGNAILNITKWGLQQFRKHYGNGKISAEDVFHYTYGILHNPAYREKYRMNLMREFPRLPFYSNFPKWAKWGKRLMDLHINFESAVPFALTRRDQKVASPAPRLKADKLRSAIIVDEATSLHEIPAEAWKYKLGGRSALEWVLDQHKEKAIKDPTIAERFNNYRFADHKERVIDLLHRVCTVSVETMKIVNQMKAGNS